MGHGGRALGVAGAHPDALFHQARLVLAQVVLKLLQPLARALVLGLHPRVVTRARSRRVGRHRNQLEVQGSVGGLAHLVDGRSQHVGLERAVLTGDEGHPLEAGEALVVADVGLDVKAAVAHWGRHLRWLGSRSRSEHTHAVRSSGPARLATASPARMRPGPRRALPRLRDSFGRHGEGRKQRTTLHLLKNLLPPRDLDELGLSSKFLRSSSRWYFVCRRQYSANSSAIRQQRDEFACGARTVERSRWMRTASS